MSKENQTFAEILFESAYICGPEDAAAFGDKWRGPSMCSHGTEHLCALYQGVGDGQNVEVYISKLPATFYTINVLGGHNSVDEYQAPYSIGTGSGGRELAEYVNKTAEMIAGGMLGFKRVDG